MTEENIKSETMNAPPLPPDPVRLVASARFIAEPLAVPPGISVRDLPGFLEGEVEEHSLFPLESTSWGYMDGRRKATGGSILLYAAFREQVNGATDPHFARRYSVLPGFAILCGRQWRKPTWVTLLEPDCVTIVRMQRNGIPDCVRSRYGAQLEESMQAAWNLRDELLKEAPIAEDEKIEDGLIRCTNPSIDRKGAVVFPLERCRQPGDNWKRWGAGKISNESVMLAADVRDSHYLAGERNRRRAVRQLRTFLRIAACAFIALGIFQYRYDKLRNETDALSEQLRAQRPAVEALKLQEKQAKGAAKLSDPPLEVFQWLEAVNASRPDNIWFLSAYADREGNLGFSGEAPSVATVNEYREALGKTTNLFASVEAKELGSAQRGVKFTLQVRMMKEGDKTDG